MWQGQGRASSAMLRAGRGVGTGNESRNLDAGCTRQWVEGVRTGHVDWRGRGRFIGCISPGPPTQFQHAQSRGGRPPCQDRRIGNRRVQGRQRIASSQTGSAPARCQLSPSSSGLCDVAAPQLGAQPVHLNHQPVAHRHLQARQAGRRAGTQAEWGRQASVSGQMLEAGLTGATSLNITAAAAPASTVQPAASPSQLPPNPLSPCPCCPLAPGPRSQSRAR
jgi:hypothetical protein